MEGQICGVHFCGGDGCADEGIRAEWKLLSIIRGGKVWRCRWRFTHCCNESPFDTVYVQEMDVRKLIEQGEKRARMRVQRIYSELRKINTIL